jgi:hypothetical protein
MKSGSFLTASTNSGQRVSLSYFVKEEDLKEAWASAAGDDCIESNIPGLVERYAAYGIKVVDHNPIVNGGFEFCSTWFENGIGKPLSWPKTLFRLLCSELDPERFEQFTYEMRYLSERTRCLNVARHVRENVSKQNEESESSS